MQLTPDVQTNFFGRDALMPFIGQVEDVNDPKGAQRVKVRMIGVHPRKKDGEDGVKTDDLPWARVGMPVMYPQTGRIGAKHGLLAGSWVFGYFLDGEDAQDPLVMCTITATAKSVGKDDAKIPKNDGTFTDAEKGFGKNYGGGENQPNAALRTKDEQGKMYGTSSDPEGHDVMSDVDLDAGKQCDGKKKRESFASYERKELENTVHNPPAQKTEIGQSDALCGPEKHAQDDTQKAVKRQIPAAQTRLGIGDVVYQRYTGKYIDMQGVMLQLTLELCNLMKSVLNAKRHLQNEKNREMIAQTVHNSGMDMDRDGVDIDEKDEKEQDMNDKFNAMFQESTIDQLCMMMMPMMQSMDMKSGDEEQVGGTPDAPQTIGGGIGDPGARCIAETIVNNVNIIGDALSLIHI